MVNILLYSNSEVQMNNRLVNSPTCIFWFLVLRYVTEFYGNIIK